MTDTDYSQSNYNLTNTAGGQTVKRGMQLEFVQDCKLKTVTLGASGTATTCYLWDNSKNLLSTKAFSSNVATFNYTLTAGTYYLVCDSGGAAYTLHYTGVVSYPYDLTYIHWLAAFVDSGGAGTYYTNQGENIDSVVITITTVDPPVASFTADVTSGYPDLSVTFTDSSTNTPTSWSWEKKSTGSYEVFSTDQNPTEDIGLGTWDIKLTATNAGGSDAEEKLDYITTTAKPISILPMSGTKHKFSNTWKFMKKWRFKTI